MITGENGILTKAQSASDQTKQKGAIEKVKLAVAGSWGNDGKINIEELKNNLNNVEGIDKSTIKASLPMLVKVDGIDVNITATGKVELGTSTGGDATDGSWTGTVNAPKLASDMTAVYWDDEGKEVRGDTSANWYDYGAQRWANAKTSDGSYWVWIPRYEYKIESGEGTSTEGEISVNFIPRETTTASAEYKIHPAFIDGTSNKYANGEWNKELSGIWVMKYEASSETPNASNGGGGNTTNLKMLSVPGVPSWRNITIGNSYTNAMNYDRSKESHVMKNSEWGAVAYLTQSKYGRNNTEVAINNDESFYTGGGEGEAYKTNTAQSTTGNTSGIYDMSGGAWERVAAYIINGDPNLSTYGSSFANATESTPYATVYPYDEADGQAANYNKYKESASTRYGDAILETSPSGADSTGWFGDYSYYPYSSYPFFVRGGSYNNGSDAGLFAFTATVGFANSSIGFRACLAF